MKSLAEISKKNFRFLFTDIDDTLTKDGQLHADTYQALWLLSQKGTSIIPVTGRPAGWCEMIARVWPVEAVVGENGAFYFSYDRKTQKMKRYFSQDETERALSRKKLDKIQQEILQNVPGSALASDQFCRLFDLAIDFCEDVPPLSKESIEQIVSYFHDAGATAKISSIHVNGWFGPHNKFSMCKAYLEKEFKLKWDEVKKDCIFIGDSPNDEPLFKEFPYSAAVANIQSFKQQLVHKPKFVTQKAYGEGFCELVQIIT